jgi:hypothetical protein
MGLGILNSMPSRVNRYILTLVETLMVCFCGNSVWATPHYDSPQPITQGDTLDHEPDPQKIENISITPAPETRANVDDLVRRFNKSNYYYPYKQEVGAHIGLVFGFRDSSESKQLMNGLIGFDYLLPSHTSPKWEAGADLSAVGHGHIHVVRRFIYNEKGSFRPYYGYGLMHKVVPEDKFATLSNWDNYLLRADIGLEDIVRPPRSVKLDLFIAIGAKDMLAMFTYGWAWGF